MTGPSFAKKAGSLFIAGFEGESVSPEHPLYKQIKELNLGGVILFDRLLAKKKDRNNITSREQILALTSEIQTYAGGDLLICVDQEGGRVSRFKAEHGFSITASAEQLGESNKLTSQAAAATAAMLASCGINVNFSPVVDLNLNRDNPIIGKYGRSFGQTASVVTEKARIWIAEHRCQNIITSLKHFPGHGSSRDDSHLGFVDISDTWQNQELEPYRTLIAEDYADTVMIGHLFNKNLDAEYPATLSHHITGELLRKRLGFKGVAISDDMQMGAITSRYGLGEACVRALKAGVDMLIIGNNLQHDPYIFNKIHRRVMEAVELGELNEYRIEEAWKRVEILKNKIRTRQIT